MTTAEAVPECWRFILERNARAIHPVHGHRDCNGSGAQTVAVYAYNNLILDGSGAKTLTTGTSVGGDLSIAPTGSAQADVTAGVNDYVNMLKLGGVYQLDGTWGSTTATSATHQDDIYFTATTGYLTVAMNENMVAIAIKNHSFETPFFGSGWNGGGSPATAAGTMTYNDWDLSWTGGGGIQVGIILPGDAGLAPNPDLRQVGYAAWGSAGGTVAFSQDLVNSITADPITIGPGTYTLSCIVGKRSGYVPETDFSLQLGTPRIPTPGVKTTWPGSVLDVVMKPYSVVWTVASDSSYVGKQMQIGLLSTVSGGWLSLDNVHLALEPDTGWVPPPAVTLAVEGPAVEGGAAATLTATRAANDINATTATIVHLTYGGTAVRGSGNDYTAADTLTIPVGSLSASIPLTALSDSAYDPDETIVANIDSVENGLNDGLQQVQTTITDVSFTILVTLDPPSPATITEGGSQATVTVRLSQAYSEAVTATLALSGTAEGTDYSATSLSILIAIGDTTGTLTLTPRADNATYQSPKTIVVDIATVETATPGIVFEDGTQQKTVTVADNDPAPVAITVPNKDGVKNFVEFAFNGDPLSGSNNGQVYVLTADGDGDSAKELILTAAVRKTAVFSAGAPATSLPVDGITYSIEGSVALSGFPTMVNLVSTAVVPAGAPDLTGTDYEYRSFSLAGSNGLPTKGFLRAKVEQTTP
ncbi:MAG: hypothetical protein NTW21_25865 [Verrucomicrobia bacterium]|nr:hypothetical protein [Verrucomicrobiota bacterium]